MQKPGKYIKGLITMLAIAIPLCFAHAQDLEHIDKKHPIKFSGNLNIQLESYNATGISNRRQPFSWLITGTPTITIYGVQLPFSFLFSNFENRYFQPFNQFGVSPSYKWVKLHLGYRNVQFSQFTLAGYRMLGAGIELNPGKFRFGFMYGRLNRSTTIDSMQNANPLAFRTLPSYTRKAYSVKVGVGNTKSYFDISYLKGWDEEKSLKKELRDSVAPQENNVVGVSWQVTLWKHIVWKTEAGLSVYTLDTHADIATADAGAAGNYFTNKGLDGIIKSTIATQHLLAGETRLGYHGKAAGADLVYRRVDPEYKSMGAYFFQTDIEQYSVAPYMQLFKNKFMLNANVGLQHDNLYGLKLATSQNVIANVNLNVNPSNKFGFNANYSNYGITQNPTYISPQSPVFKQVSQNVTVSPFVNLINTNSADNIQLVACYQLLNTPSTGITTNSDQATTLGMFSYAHSWLAKQITANLAVNYNNTTLTGQGNIGSYGAGGGVSFTLLKKLNFNTNVTYNANYYNSKSNGYTISGDVNCAVTFYKKHTIQLSGLIMNNNAKDETVIKSFSEYTFRFIYGFTF